MIFLRFTHNNPKAQKYLLGAYEKLVGDEYKDQLFGSSMKILKQFYDEDILEEASILEWSAKESKKYVGKEMSKKIHEKVAPFIEWLKTAEEEEDSDEEDEDNHAEPNKEKREERTTTVSKTNGNKASDEDDDDDMFEFSHRVQGLSIQPIKAQTVITPINADVAAVAAGNQDEGDDDLDIDNI